MSVMLQYTNNSEGYSHDLTMPSAVLLYHDAFLYRGSFRIVLSEWAVVMDIITIALIVVIIIATATATLRASTTTTENTGGTLPSYI